MSMSRGNHSEIAEDEAGYAIPNTPPGSNPKMSKIQVRMSDVGKACEVEGYGKGIIRFLGKHHESGFNRAGVELDGPRGKNGGTIGGHKYFSCPPKHGILIKLIKLTWLQPAQKKKQPSAKRPLGQKRPLPQGQRKGGGGSGGSQKGGIQRGGNASSFNSMASTKLKQPTGDSPFALYSRPVRHVPDSLVTTNPKTKAAWYVGLVNRNEVEAAVMGANSGDFLVRMSADNQSYAMCINDNNKASHNFKVTCSNGKVMLKDKAFASLEELVQSMRKQPLTTTAGRLVPLADSCSTHDWFVGCMSEDQCTKMVQAAGNCDFLVRLRLNPKEYTLMINDTGSVSSNAIMIDRSGGFVLGINGEQFSSLPEVIETLRDESPFVSDNGRKLFLRKSAAAADWYVGPMSRFATENAVMLGKIGDFLLRQSSDGQTYVLCVNSGEKVKNFKILNSDKGFTFNKKLYKNIESIVRALKKDPLQGDNGKAYNLGGAAPKPQDEQEVIGEENEFEEEVPDNSASTGGGDEDFGGGFDEADGQTAGLMEMMAMAEKRRASLLEADEEEEEEEDEDESDDDDATPPAAPDDDDDEGKFEGEDEDFDGDAFDDDAAAEPPAQKEKFDPFRVVCTAAFDGMEEGASAFVIGEADDDNWQAVLGGAQVNIPKASVVKETVEESAAKRADAAIAAISDEEEELEELEERETPEAKEARLAARKLEIEAKMAQATADAMATLAASGPTEEELAMEKQLAESQAALENFGGFDDDDDDEDD